jgi:hypothetical protein
MSNNCLRCCYCGRFILMGDFRIGLAKSSGGYAYSGAWDSESYHVSCLERYHEKETAQSEAKENEG